MVVFHSKIHNFASCSISNGFYGESSRLIFFFYSSYSSYDLEQRFFRFSKKCRSNF
jgi:hypothetical protein